MNYGTMVIRGVKHMVYTMEDRTPYTLPYTTKLGLWKIFMYKGFYL